MHAATDPRYRKRLPCRLRVPSGKHSGMVLNLSRSGMFVQTGAAVSPGDAVHLDLAVGDEGTVGVDARVVWRRQVAPHLRTVSTGGMGVHIQYASDVYFGLVARLAEGAPLDESAAVPREAAPGPAFRVRLRFAGSSRTRIVTVAAVDEREACERARQRMGAQWEALDLEKIERDA